MNNFLVKYIISFVALIATVFFTFNLKAQETQQDTTTTKEAFPEAQPVTDMAELNPHLGFQLGYAEVGEGFNRAVEYGVEVGFQPYIPFGVALEFTRFSSDLDDASGDLRRSKLMAKGTYNFGGSTPIIRHSFIGAGLGPVFDSYAGTEDTSVGINFLAGFDLPLTRKARTANGFTLGAAANYLIVADAEDNFLLNGQLKYWF